MNKIQSREDLLCQLFIDYFDQRQREEDSKKATKNLQLATAVLAIIGFLLFHNHMTLPGIITGIIAVGVFCIMLAQRHVWQDNRKETAALIAAAEENQWDLRIIMVQYRHFDEWADEASRTNDSDVRQKLNPKKIPDAWLLTVFLAVYIKLDRRRNYGFMAIDERKWLKDHVELLQLTWKN